MLSSYPVHPSLATSDIDRARAWYADKLGLEPELVLDSLLLYRLGAGTFSVYETEVAGTAKNTVATWAVKDFGAALARLRRGGVVLEEYDFGSGFQTVDGVMEDPTNGSLAAWFKDADGNIIGLLYDPDDPRPEGISAMIAAADVGRAKAWYAERLGFAPVKEIEAAGVVVYESGGQPFTIYQTDFAGTARNTVAVWRVDDLRAEVAELRGRGVTFEDYDFGDARTIDGVLEEDGHLNAWFTDSEGNILALVQQPAG